MRRQPDPLASTNSKKSSYRTRDSEGQTTSASNTAANPTADASRAPPMLATKNGRHPANLRQPKPRRPRSHEHPNRKTHQTTRRSPAARSHQYNWLHRRPTKKANRRQNQRPINHPPRNKTNERKPTNPLNPICLAYSKQVNQHRLKGSINRVDDHCLGESKTRKTESAKEAIPSFLARIGSRRVAAKINPGKINGFFSSIVQKPLTLNDVNRTFSPPHSKVVVRNGLVFSFPTWK